MQKHRTIGTNLKGHALNQRPSYRTSGTNQATAYAKATGRPIKRTTYPVNLELVDGERISKGTVDISIALTNGSHIGLEVHVVSADIPLLIGIEVLQNERIILEFGNRVIKNE